MYVIATTITYILVYDVFLIGVNMRNILKELIKATTLENLENLKNKELINNNDYTKLKNFIEVTTDIQLIIHEDNDHIFKVKVYSDTPLHRDNNFTKLFTGKANEFHVTHTKFSIVSLFTAIDIALNSETKIVFKLPTNDIELNTILYQMFNG